MRMKTTVFKCYTLFSLQHVEKQFYSVWSQRDEKVIWDIFRKYEKLYTDFDHIKYKCDICSNQATMTFELAVPLWLKLK